MLVTELGVALEDELEPEGVMVCTPPPMVETMISPFASVEVTTSPLVIDEEDAGADVVAGLDEAGAEEVGENDDDDDATTDEVGELEALELDETGRTELRVDPCEMGGTGVAT